MEYCDGSNIRIFDQPREESWNAPDIRKAVLENCSYLPEVYILSEQAEIRKIFRKNWENVNFP